MRALAAWIVLLVLVPGAQAGHDATDWSQAEAVPLVEDADAPANIAVADDGSVWYAEVYTGDLWRQSVDGARERVRHVDVEAGGERGLVGFAPAHDFQETGAYYLYYTAPDPEAENGTNRLVRVEDGGETLLATVPGAPEHNGGRILVDPEGDLFVSTGENQLRDPAQDPGSLLGKILHMTPEGGPVEGGSGVVYSLGHRNVYGLALDPATGQLWATENSGWRRDEVNRIEAGGNYGYPECEGRGLNGVDTPCPTNKGYIFPVMSFYEDRTAAPTGAAFWKGGLYWASLREGSIHHLWEEGGEWKDAIVHDTEGVLLDLHVGPLGHLHYATMDGVYRIGFPGEPAPSYTGGSAPSGETFAPRGSAPPEEAPIPSSPWLVVGLALLALARRRRT